MWPFLAAFEKYPRPELDIWTDYPYHAINTGVDINEHTKHVISNLQPAHHYSRTNLKRDIIRRNEYYKETAYKMFLAGTIVYLSAPGLKARKHQSTNMTAAWSGPCQIADKINDLIFCIISKV